MTRPTLAELREIAADVAGPAAHDVDSAARFPHETVTALRKTGLLGVSLDHPDDGPAWSIPDLAAGARALGARCSSSGMVWAMHHSQQLAVARHGDAGEPWRETRATLASGATLIASAASEGSGDFSTSKAALAPAGHATVSVDKSLSAVSFGEAADAFLVSARAAPDAKPTDVVLALVWADQCEMSIEGDWDALGMRGTATVPMTLRAQFPALQVLPEPFDTIYRRTVVPSAHVLWTACWTGIADAAVAQARRKLRAAKGAGSAAVTLSDAAGQTECARRLVADAATRLERAFNSPDAAPELQSLTGGLWVNELKIQVSTLVTSAVLAALRVIGLPGYLEHGSLSIARQVRDVLSTELMVGNHRLRDVNAQIEPLRTVDL